MTNALNQRFEKKKKKHLSKPIGANRNELVRTSLQQKLDRRLKQVDIERSGVVPHNYFDNPVSVPYFVFHPPSSIILHLFLPFNFLICT